MIRTILPALILAATAATAQQDATTPTFRAGTKLVEVDVVARPTMIATAFGTGLR